MPIGFPEFFKQTLVDGMCFHSALFVCTPECAWSDKAWWRLPIFACGTKRLSNGQVETIHYKLITHNWPAADPQPSKVFLLICVKYHVCRLTNNPPVNSIWAGPLRVVTQEKTQVLSVLCFGRKGARNVTPNWLCQWCPACPVVGWILSGNEHIWSSGTFWLSNSVPQGTFFGWVRIQYKHGFSALFIDTPVPTPIVPQRESNEVRLEGWRRFEHVYRTGMIFYECGK